jgi:hypothetical protein
MVSSLIVFLHVVFMFTAVAISYGPELLLIIAIRTGRTEMVRAVTAVSERSNPGIPVFYLGGGLLGLIAAINLGYNLLAPWLIMAYVLFAYNMVVGAAVFGRWATGVAKRTRALPDGPFPPELALVLRDSASRCSPGSTSASSSPSSSTWW